MTNRNAACQCGSGKRYKHCCGLISPSSGVGAAGTVSAVMNRALAAQHAGDHTSAAVLYEEVLVLDADNADCLHMLAVCRFYEDDLFAALQLILRALDIAQWKPESYKHNLLLFLAKYASQGAVTKHGRATRDRYREWIAQRDSVHSKVQPLVSVVMPSYNHSAYVQMALESVFAQSYRNIELIVIDDGSTDASPALIESVMARCPFPHRVVMRSNKGSVATVNEGFGLSAGAFLNVLHSDDCYAPTRIEKLVEAVAQRGQHWGFSDVEFINADGRTLDAGEHAPADWLSSELKTVPAAPSVGMAFLTTNVSITTGNIFVSKDFLLNKVPLRVFKYNDDWDFCLRASRQSEPVFVNEKLFRYRYHGKNTILMSGDGPRIEAVEIFRDYMEQDQLGSTWHNPYAPCSRVWGEEFLLRFWAKGQSLLVDDATLRRMAVAVVVYLRGGSPGAGPVSVEALGPVA